MTSTLYTLSYNYADGLYWAIPAIIAFGLFASSQALAAEHARGKNVPMSKALLSLRLSALIMLLVFAFGFGSSLLSYKQLSEAYMSGEVLHASGEVENLSPAAFFPPAPESFSLGGTEFSYSDYELVHGYHRTGEDSLITANGQKLDIAYIETEDGRIIVEINEIR